MRRLLVGFFAAIGFLSFLFAIAVAVLIARLPPSQPALPGDIILSVDLNSGLAEGPGAEGWRRVVFGNKPSERDFLDALETAGADPRVKGILARIGADPIGLAHVQEVRDAIA